MHKNIQHTQSVEQQERYKAFLQQTVVEPYLLQQRGSKEQYQELQKSGWEFKGNGEWEFSGDVLDANMPRLIRNNVKKITAPNATEAHVFGYPALTEITAPNVTLTWMDRCPVLTKITAPKVNMVTVYNCPALTEITAPNATEVKMYDCPALTEITAPNATEVKMYDCPVTEITAPKVKSVIVDTEVIAEKIISQVENPQNLDFFMVSREDITKDIKKADMELNNEYEEECVQLFLQHNMAKLNQQTHIKRDIDETYLADPVLGKALGCYNFADDKDQRKVLVHNLKSNPETKRQFNFDSITIEKDFKDYKKQNIVQKTRENAQARGINF